MTECSIKIKHANLLRNINLQLLPSRTNSLYLTEIDKSNIKLIKHHQLFIRDDKVIQVIILQANQQLFLFVDKNVEWLEKEQERVFYENFYEWASSSIGVSDER